MIWKIYSWIFVDWQKIEYSCFQLYMCMKGLHGMLVTDYVCPLGKGILHRVRESDGEKEK